MSYTGGMRILRNVTSLALGIGAAIIAWADVVIVRGWVAGVPSHSTPADAIVAAAVAATLLGFAWWVRP